MKIVLELKNLPTKNDIIVYNGNEWECISKQQFLSDIPRLEKEIGLLADDITQFKEKVNEKLKEYHDVIRLLVEE